MEEQLSAITTHIIATRVTADVRVSCFRMERTLDQGIALFNGLNRRQSRYIAQRKREREREREREYIPVRGKNRFSQKNLIFTFHI